MSNVENMTQYHAAEAADNIISLILENQTTPSIDIYTDPTGLATSIAKFRKLLISELMTQPASFKLLRRN